MCDANYRFTVIDVGAKGREGDAGVFSSSTLNDAIEFRSLGIPSPERLPGSERVLPYVIVGDEAFPLKTNLMRPYPGRSTFNLSYVKNIYNYR